MSIISSRFNRFYHRAVLVELFNRCGTLRFPLWVDDETGGVFEFVKGEHFNCMDELKQILKNMNLDYAIIPTTQFAEDYEKISTANIESGALVDHIDWIIALAAENNVTFDFIEDEWNCLLNQAGINH